MSKQTPHFWFEWILSSLQEGKVVEITAKGWSMWPTIKPGTSISISKVELSELQPGDLIAFTRAEHFVVHRIEEIQRNGAYTIYTRGDANLRRDEPITEDNFCGKVIGINAQDQSKQSYSKEMPRMPQRLKNSAVQFFQINMARAKKIPSLLKRDWMR
jgi:signal peptidase I